MKKLLFLVLFAPIVLLTGCKSDNASDATEAEEITADTPPPPGAVRAKQKVWTLSSYGTLENMITVPDGIAATTFIDFPGNQIGGNTGCNDYTATFERSGDGIVINQIATAEKACSDELMQFEATFLDMMRKVTTYEMSMSRIVYNTSDGKRLLFLE